MQSKILLAKNHVDLESGVLLRHVKSETEYFRPHRHDYYEIFLVLTGKAKHFVNGQSFPIESGYLIFVRDTDDHDYYDFEKTGLEFLNLSFTAETFADLITYLGDGFDSKELLNTPFPPQIKLSEKEANRLHMDFATLHTIDLANKSRIKLTARLLLANIFTRYFCDLPGEEGDIPLWLENAHDKMNLPANFIKGKERFFELCGKTREHCTRSLAKHYGMTPSGYVNNLRLGYAANLLLSSNLSSTEICFECGFRNLSHFYTEFEKKFGVTPGAFRQRTGVRE